MRLEPFWVARFRFSGKMERHLKWGIPNHWRYWKTETVLDATQARPFTISRDHRNLGYVHESQSREEIQNAYSRQALLLGCKTPWFQICQPTRSWKMNFMGRHTFQMEWRKTWKIILISPVRPLYEDSFEWPSLKEIRESLEISEDDCPENFVLDPQLNVHVNSAELIWVPRGNDLRERTSVIAHSGMAGHRGMRTTQRAISSKFFWPSMKETISEFTKACLHCIGDSKVPSLGRNNTRFTA